MDNEIEPTEEARTGEIINPLAALEGLDPDIIELLSIRIGEHRFPRITIQQCHTCTHPARFWIEAQVIGHTPASWIVAHIPDSDRPTPSEQGIRNHFEKHHVDRATEAKLDRYVKGAEEMGMSLEEYFGTLSKEVTTAQLVVDKFHERLVNDPTFVPEMKDGLGAIKLLKEITQDAEGEGNDSFTRNDLLVVLSIFMAHTRTIFAHYIPRDMDAAMGDLGGLLEADPILSPLVVKTKTAETFNLYSDDPEAEDAEVVEEETDEPLAEVVAAFEQGEPGVTGFTTDDFADDPE